MKQQKNLYCLCQFALLASLLVPFFAHAETSLHVFAGMQTQRDLMRKLFDEYEKKNPGIKIEVETGGATSDLQRQYLSTVFNARDSTLDVYLTDITTPAPFSNAGWMEPLNQYLGSDSAAFMSKYLPVYARADVIDNRIVALPAYADALFLYYRKDLLEKYKLKEPTTWQDLAQVAMTIQKAENDPNLQGISFQGAPIESTVCTFLIPYWSQGKAFNDASGKLTLDKTAAEAGMNMWIDLIDKGVAKKNIAEVKTPDTTTEFKAGKAIFAMTWAFAWDAFGNDADSRVKGKVGVLPLPAMPGGKSATCVGGWQWAVSAFSRRKAEAVKFLQYVSSPEASKFLAVEGSLLPVFPQSYNDADVQKANPWYAQYALPAVMAGETRPVSGEYAQISNIIKNVTSAMLAKTRSVKDGVADIENKTRRVMR